ncbi:bifunctional UDP-N-acetylmuramoyl-tripeptide:D-alanyl-D-alanine ligase/alanine racemase [Terrimonas sp.]|uniref:bifunctional UDP-N-acetylmuramoyl-tripeptide:D-alanyl-D-alanine ligase/alanine racemase n=1 Tax=Terrimonas sp. TaxID=1914338 RepID=UPI000D50D860|nr:bifunctional UDP-N-acetylmuramoyl-tripeptide:D-alanyl-D-alanine ligase/alanine racemase [Terrimonas sp.]PVD49563.1 bifunctional UDP-N-acetylmuramoyl-tripeptide:D-alanyl-D-alanine ligase/alanine racemase [Terrimonas sp.]
MTSAYTISNIAGIVHGKLKKGAEEPHIEYLLTDSRKLTEASTTLFFALDGFRRNGDSFIDELYNRGVRNFITNDSFNSSAYADANFIQVANVLQALQTLTAWHRSQFNIPVTGITGSNGKTIVKEWLNTLLEKEYTIARSPKSYNSQIGVPLSVWQLNNTHTLGIFEAGISLPGEMQHLTGIIQPTIGILTHIGDAHSEHFETIEQKISEKLKLFTNVQWMVANGDNELVRSAIVNADLPCIFLGKKAYNDLQVLDIAKRKGTTGISLKLEGGRWRAEGVGRKAGGDKSLLYIELPFTDDASIENAITCCCVLLKLGYDHATISERMLLLKPVGMRLEMKKGINNCSIINDSYIADISSLSIALDFLQQQQQHNKRTVILSDFFETGIAEENLYKEIANTLKRKKISYFIGIGNKLQQYQALFREACSSAGFFISTDDFIQHFHSSAFHNETILIKGARAFGFERISSLLEQKTHQTVLEVNLTAIIHNLKQYQQLLQPSTKIMAMVKAFSYGSGSFEIANILQFQKIDYLAVAYTDEGVELRKSGISLPVMVMNPEPESFALLTEYHLEPEIFSFPILNTFLDFLKTQGIQHYPIHLKIDTGMHRLGFELNEISELAEILSTGNFFKVQSVFSHLAGSEDPELDYFTLQQVETYRKAYTQLQAALPYSFLRHISNSASIARHPQLHFDMVRLGIGLYGVDTTHSPRLELREAATLKTTIAQIKKIPGGETVGYGRKGKIEQESTIATIRIGYADGYRRIFSNGTGKILVHGQLAPVTGNIAMDMTMVDITGIPGVQEGDEVIIFGDALPVTTLAQWANTIPYELMTGISQRVQRVYFEE